MFLESSALKSFRRKMANPLHWRKANQLFTQYSKADLANLSRTEQLIDELAAALDVALNSSERRQAAQWLVGQRIDPSKRRDRLMLWKKAK